MPNRLKLDSLIQSDNNSDDNEFKPLDKPRLVNSTMQTIETNVDQPDQLLVPPVVNCAIKTREFQIDLNDYSDQKKNLTKIGKFLTGKINHNLKLLQRPRDSHQTFGTGFTRSKIGTSIRGSLNTSSRVQSGGDKSIKFRTTR